MADPAEEDEAEAYSFPFSSVGFSSSCLNLAQSTPTTVVKVMDHLQDHMHKSWTNASTKYLDLGCGDGRYVFEAAKRGFHAVGIDSDPAAIATCHQLAKENGLQHKCQFILNDFFEFDLSPYNLISCYLYSKTMGQVARKLKDRLMLGDCIVATVLYKPAGWVPMFTDDLMKVFLFDGATRFK